MLKPLALSVATLVVGVLALQKLKQPPRSQQKTAQKKQTKKRPKKTGRNQARTFQGRNTHHHIKYPCRIVVCENEFEYRKAVSYVGANDVALEVCAGTGVHGV